MLHSSVLQCVAVCCSVLKDDNVKRCLIRAHTATHCNTLQHSATQTTHCNRWQRGAVLDKGTRELRLAVVRGQLGSVGRGWLHHGRYTAVTHCNNNNTAAHCNTLQYAAILCNTLQYAAIHCNTLEHIAIYNNTPHHTAIHCNTLRPLQYTAPYYSDMRVTCV